MQKFSTLAVLSALLFIGSFAAAQNAQPTLQQPIIVSSDFFASHNITAQHMASSTVSSSTNAAIAAHDQRVITLPNFTRSFTFGGTVFPYTMIGNDPIQNKPANITTTYIPMTLAFQGIVDGNGNTFTLDATTITNEVKNSPLFVPTDLPNGNLQFEDGQMRAEFFPFLNNNSNWHVSLGTPQTLIPVTILVPRGAAELFEDSTSGAIVAVVDLNFLRSQLNTLFQTEGISSNTIPIFITRNTVYATVTGGVANLNTCCVGGFHNAFESGSTNNKIFVQTFAFATSLDTAVATFTFGDPGVFADINPLSHELGELLNDPFVNNITPRYQLPGLPPGACQGNLEVGDNVENLQPDYTMITLNGFTYHPQTLSLLQWFEGISPSDAFNADYSYPDATRLTQPFTPCPTGP